MSEKSLALRRALFAAIVAISAAPLFGPALYGSDVTLTNQSSAAVNDANVTLTNVGIGERKHNTSAVGNYLIGGGKANQGATYYDGVPANSDPGNVVNMALNLEAICEFRVHAGLAIPTSQTARMDLNLKVSAVGATVEVAAHAPQIQAESSALSNDTEDQVINDVPQCDESPLFYPLLQNGVQPHRGTTTSTLGDLYNDRQSASPN
jgi:hypothetical protein